MKPSQELFLLIKSLTKSEKRYFQLNASTDKIYQKMFDLLHRQEQYDEEQLVSQLDLKQPHVYKNYLYKLILKSLRSFHAEASQDSIIYQHMHDFEILFAKGLLKQAEKSLAKSKALAQAREKRFILSQIYQLEQKLYFKKPRRKEELAAVDYTRRQGMVNEQLAVVKAQEVAYELTRRFYKTSYLLTAESKREITTIYTSLQEITAQINDFLIYKYWADYLFHCMSGNFFAAFQAAQQFIELIDHSHTVFDLSVLSCEIAYSHASCTIRIKELNEHYTRYGLFPEDFLLKLPHGHYASKSVGIMNLYLFYQTGKYKQGLAYWKTLESNHWEEVSEISIATHHAACVLHFCEGNYKESLKHCNWIINESTPGFKDDFYVANLLIRIIIHFEMGSYEVVEELITKIKRPLKEFTFFQPLDGLLLGKLKCAMLAQTKTEFRDHMQALDKEFERLSPQMENLHKFKYYFNFKEWIKSKAENKPFAQAIEEANRALLLK